MSWKDDAKFVGVMVRGGDWEIGLRIARSVWAKADGAGRPSNVKSNIKLYITPDAGRQDGEELRCTMVEFGVEAGISQPTVRRYLAAWEWASEAGMVDPAAELGPEDEYDFSEFPKSERTEGGDWVEGCWKSFYEVAAMNPPPWNPQGKAMDPAYGGGRQETAVTNTPAPTPAQVATAIKNDRAAEQAAKETIYEMMETDRNHAIEAVKARGGTITPIADIRKRDQERFAGLIEMCRAEGQLSEKIKLLRQHVSAAESLIEAIAKEGPFGSETQFGTDLQHVTKALSDGAWTLTATIVEAAQA